MPKVTGDGKLIITAWLDKYYHKVPAEYIDDPSICEHYMEASVFEMREFLLYQNAALIQGPPHLIRNPDAAVHAIMRPRLVHGPIAEPSHTLVWPVIRYGY